MQKLDFYTKMKMELVMMDMDSYDCVIDIVALPLYCPWLLNDDNLLESYSRLTDIFKQNMTNLTTFMQYIMHLDETGTDFSLSDLKDEYEYIKDNISLQAEFYSNMLSYIDFCDDYTNPRADVEKFCDSYCEKDDEIFDQVQINYSLIKSIREERKKKN